MQIGNCPECGKLYQKNATGMCPNCYKKEEEYEQIVAEYVRDHQKCSVSEIHEATGVKEKTIIRMIKNGRFFNENTMISYPCQQCGAPIYEGRICQKCNESFLKQVKDAEEKRKNLNSSLNQTGGTDKVKSKGMYTKNMR